MTATILQFVSPKPTENKGLFIESIYGYCPVKADGLFDHEQFYFEARGSSWKLVLHPFTSKEQLIAEEEFPGGVGAAGWMSDDQAKRFITREYMKLRGI